MYPGILSSGNTCKQIVLLKMKLKILTGLNCCNLLLFYAQTTFELTANLIAHNCLTMSTKSMEASESKIIFFKDTQLGGFEIKL